MDRPTLFRLVRAIVLLPGIVLVAVPALILLGAPPPPVAPAVRVVLIVAGLAAVAVGLSLGVATTRMLFREGRGTPAPWDATRKLVVRGVYRRVRNPMMTGVFCILLGEAAAFASTALLTYLVIVIVVNLLYIPLVEERGLERRFGEQYREYKRNVPRWIPRRTPWQPPSAQA